LDRPYQDFLALVAAHFANAVAAAENLIERKRSEQTNLLLIAELQHRSRNLLAVVSAVARQTLTSCITLDDFSTVFNNRLAALSRVQGLLSREEGKAVMLNGLVQLELRAQGAEPDGQRVVISGPDVPLPRESVQILALSLHELATNARKYGALRTGEGRLAVTWQLTSEGGNRRLDLKWHESGFTPHDLGITSLRKGFGRKLIEESLPYQLDAKTSLQIGQNEVLCSISIDLQAL
jgi:two-component sensor histidine kinase